RWVNISAGGGGGDIRRISQHLSGSDGLPLRDARSSVTAWSGCQFTALGHLTMSCNGVNIGGNLTKNAVNGLAKWAIRVFSSLDELKPPADSSPSPQAGLLILTSAQQMRAQHSDCSQQWISNRFTEETRHGGHRILGADCFRKK
uniref:Protein Wnt n=1 Tax=Macrostomum lignano TaxID=282301 RepID=A0A1I8FAK2_9PLAT